MKLQGPLKLVLLAVLLLGIVSRTAHAEEDDEVLDSDLDAEVSEEDVLILTKHNFTDALQKYEYLMVRLLACGRGTGVPSKRPLPQQHLLACCGKARNTCVQACMVPSGSAMRGVASIVAALDVVPR